MEREENITINKLINQVLNEIPDKDKPIDQREFEAALDDKDRLFVFASYDLCESTKMKKEYDFWFDIVDVFIKACDCISFMNVWKYNGDEVLFSREVTSLQEIVHILAELYSGLNSIQKAIIDTVKKRVEKRGKEQTAIFNVDLKATIWIANTYKGTLDKNFFGNYEFNVGTGTDFSGINIDEGFRLCHHAMRHRLVVDPKIAYILYLFSLYFKDDNEKIHLFSDIYPEFKEKIENTNGITVKEITNCVKKLRLVDYQVSKGIWNERLYPIVWYSEDWKKEFFAQDSIRYDERLSDCYLIDVARELEDENEIKYSVSRLIRIFEQVSEIEEIKKILSILEISANDDITPVSHTISLDNITKLYYMVVCINKSGDKALIFERSKNRKHLKGVWDFGNVRHNASQHKAMKAVIEARYKETFGIEIDVVLDEKRKEIEKLDAVKPFALCSVPRYGVIHSGILCFARIKTEGTDEDIIKIINKKLSDDRERYSSLYRYDSVLFVNEEYLNDNGFEELSFEETIIDSKNANLNKSEGFLGEKRYINNLKTSITEAITYIQSEEN